MHKSFILEVLTFESQVYFHLNNVSGSEIYFFFFEYSLKKLFSTTRFLCPKNLQMVVIVRERGKKMNDL